MENNKGVISLNLDNDLIEIINKYSNRSARVNDILREHLLSDERLEKEILKAKKHLEKLEQQQANKHSFLDEVDEQVINTIIPPPLSGDEMLSRIQRDTRKVKDIINESDDPREMLNSWTNIVNNKHGTKYTPEQLQQVLDKYS